MPPGLRFSFAAGIGLFLAFIGLNEAGIVTLGVAGAPVRIGALNSAAAMVAIFSFIAIAMLTLWRVPGAILIGILLASAAAFALGVASLPPSMG